MKSTITVRDDFGRFAGPNPGRPRKYQDIDSFQAAIDDYFDKATRRKEPPTVSGLACALGTTRLVLLNYEQYDDAEPFANAIKDAKARVEARTVAILLKANSKVHPAGPIFVLKNNHGYRDVQEVQIDSRSVVMGVQVSIEQHRQELETLGVNDHFRQIANVNGDRPSLDTSPLSPGTDTAIPLSPIESVAVTVDRPEAKATPIDPVSPHNVA